MKHEFGAGQLALMTESTGVRVRKQPNTGSTKKGVIPEHAILALLSPPSDHSGNYPVDDGKHEWFKVRGRTDQQRVDGSYIVVEGWMAVSENKKPWIQIWNSGHGCNDTMGTSLKTHLQSGQTAYVIGKGGLFVRVQSNPQAAEVTLLREGTVVTLVGEPDCDSKMVWWQVMISGTKQPRGWSSEGNHAEWLLAPLSLKG